MRTIISGPVTANDLEDAEIFGIEPTSFLSDGSEPPPKGVFIDTKVYKADPMLPGEPGVLRRDWVMCLDAEAIIIVGDNWHLKQCAKQAGLPLFYRK